MNTWDLERRYKTNKAAQILDQNDSFRPASDSLRRDSAGRDGRTSKNSPPVLHDARSAPDQTSPSIAVHYTISEDRSGSQESVKSSILAVLGERERKRNMDLSVLVRK